MESQSPRWHDPGSSEEDFAAEIATLRVSLRSYVMTILPHREACDDIVQETSVFLWERRGERHPETNLKAWAFRVAWFKAMAWRRDRCREKTVHFSESTLHEISSEAESVADRSAERLLALRHCLARLRPEDLRLLQLRYLEGGSLTHHALDLQQKPSRVQKTISRLRLVLRRCIESKLSAS